MTTKTAVELTPERIEKLAYDIKDFLVENLMWIDVCIYFNGKSLSTDDGNGHYAYNDGDTNYIKENVKPSDYFEYVGEGILCMSFEGMLYDILNGYMRGSYYREIEYKFCELLAKYGLYYELGDTWNLSLARI